MQYKALQLNIRKHFNKQLCSYAVNKCRCNGPLYCVTTLFLYTQWCGFGKASHHCLDPYVKYVYWFYPSPLVCIHYPVCFVRRMRCRWGTLITLHWHTSIMDPWNLVSHRKGSRDKNPFDLSRGKLIIQLLLSLCFPDNFRAIHNRLSHWDNTMASCCIIISHASHQHKTSAATKNSLDTWETVSIFLNTLFIFFPVLWWWCNLQNSPIDLFLTSNPWCSHPFCSNLAWRLQKESVVSGVGVTLF